MIQVSADSHSCFWGQISQLQLLAEPIEDRLVPACQLGLWLPVCTDSEVSGCEVTRGKNVFMKHSNVPIL